MKQVRPGSWATTSHFGYATVTYGAVASRETCAWRPARLLLGGVAEALGGPPRRRLERSARSSVGWARPEMGDGVIGSPQAFGALQSRFESESPSTSRHRGHLPSAAPEAGSSNLSG